MNSAEAREISSIAASDILIGGGFNTSLAVDSLVRKYQHGLTTGLSKQAALIKPTRELRADIIGFKLEYMQYESWLPSPLEKRQYRGRERIFNQFSNLPVSEGILRQERFGAVADSMVQVEDFLLDCPNNSMAAVVSRAGWSGLQDRLGRDITYPDAQVYLFYKDGQGRLQENTLVMDELSDGQYQRLCRFINATNTDWLDSDQTQEQRLAAMVRNVGLMPDTKNDFVDIVRAVQFIKGSNIVRSIPEQGVVRTFTEVYQQIDGGNRLLDPGSRCQKVINQLEQYLVSVSDNLQDPEVKRQIRAKLNLTILKIARALRGELEIDDITEANLSDEGYMRSYFAKDIQFVQSLTGCNGGGNILEVILKGQFGPRRGRIESSGFGEGSCVICRKIAQIGPCFICHNCAQSAA